LDSGTLPADRSTPCIPRQPEHFLLTTIPLATNTTQEPKKDAKPQGRNESEFTRIVSKRYADVYKIDKHYIGLLRELPPPSEVQNKWDQDIRPELENHLCQATRLLSKSMRDEEVITEPVLCMAGKKCSPSSVTMEPGVVCPKDPIALNPTLWIYCGSKKCKKKVSEAIRTLAYLRHFVERFNMDAPYTSLHAPWPAAKDNALFSDNTLGNYNSVSFSIQQSKLRTEVGCGVKAKFTIQASFGSIERHSIIGGYIMVDSSLFGLTSAHGIVNCLRDLSHNSSSASDESKNLSNESSEIDSDYVSSSGSESDASEDIKPFLATSNADAKRYPLPADKGYTALEDEWMTTSTPGIIAYMGHGTSAGDLSLPHAAPSTADFALVDVQSIGAPSNEYHDQSQGSSSVITDYLPTAQITSGDVWIIYSHSAPALKGYLLEGNASIILRGTVIRTKKIQLKSPGCMSLLLLRHWHH
jgi:hypothetical protein